MNRLLYFHLGPLQTTDPTTELKRLCTGQDCPQRWMSSPWSTCSVSCGGGVQSRRVICLLGERVDGVGATEENPCAQAGKRPPDTQPCNPQPCKSWATSSWSPSQCHGPCVGLHLAMQKRQVFCQAQTGTRLPTVECRALPRPNSHRNCSTESCFPHWRTGAWTQCTATCGSHGFQSRRVTCIRPRGPSGAPLQLNCPLRGRPAGWRRCNIQPCSGAAECRDSTRYCEKVQQLELCSLAQFKTRCCESCRAT
ncbi:ADAMTS-like protein 1 [Scleropages formosus]|uniref:ADAMTS-like protein 1 n=1 Tax=Scleropages formosus TaxID=113540 RepID=UPI00087874C3|nr:ADAMTS-like protein 1 [Scleropages formosus]